MIMLLFSVFIYGRESNCIDDAIKVRKMLANEELIFDDTRTFTDDKKDGFDILKEIGV